MTEYRFSKENQEQTSPRSVRYQILASHQELDGVSYLTYGIQCLGNRAGRWVQMDAVEDLSFQRDFVARLIERFNRLQLSPVHFRDAVLDCVNA